MNKSRMPALIFLSFFCVLLAGCSVQSIEKASMHSVPISNAAVAFGAEEGSSINRYSMTNSGALLMDNQLMQYYDFAEGKRYVLCTKENCKHMDSTCSAFYLKNIDINYATGLATIGDCIYVVKRNEQNNSYELLEMNRKGELQRIVTSIDIEHDMEKSPSDYWVLHDVSAVAYTKDMAWLTLKYRYISNGSSSFFNDYHSGNCILGIHLSDGTVEEVFPLVSDDERCSLVFLSSNYMIALKWWHSLPLLNHNELASAIERGEYPQFSGLDDPDGAYNTWWMKNHKIMYEFVIYDIEAETQSILDRGEARLYYDNNQNVSGWTYPFHFMGQTYDGLIAYYKEASDYDLTNGGDTDVFVWNPEDDMTEHILHIENGFPFAVNPLDDVRICMIDQGEKFYYRVISEDHQSKTVYAYHLKTGESSQLFSYELNSGFSLSGESDQYFIGSFLDSSSNDIFMIRKTDYEAGNFNAAQKCSLP